ADVIAGGLLTLIGHGLTPNGKVSVRVDGHTVLATAADGAGNFQTDVVVPQGLPAGTHRVDLLDRGTGRLIQTPLRVVAPRGRRVQAFHLVGDVFVRHGPPLRHLDGILTVQAEAGTGDFTGHARLQLANGAAILAPAGWLLGATLHLRVAGAGLMLSGQGTA